MADFQRIFARDENPVLSFQVQARIAATAAPQRSVSEVLVRHFLDRFIENEVVSLGGDTLSRVAQVISALTVPGIVVALYLIPAYYGFPPHPLHRPYWSEVSDHYFYVVYSFVLIGALTVLEWDLLFPDLLDVLVLTPLPVPARKLFLSKVQALIIFLGLFLLGMNAAGSLLLPAIAGHGSFPRHILAHAFAVTCSGVFTALFFVALQGLLLSLFGERLFRRISSLLQALSLTLLLIVLFMFPLISGSLELLLHSGEAAVRWFPPFWFLGMYESLLDGSASPAIFHSLAARGAISILLLIAIAALTYPIAYGRTVRRTIEGSTMKDSSNRIAHLWHILLHWTCLRRPQQRGVYHFISQTLTRGARNRVFLSMYAGLGFALILAGSVGLVFHQGRVSIVFSTYGLLSSIPIAAFWVVSGLRVALRGTVDAPAGWIFRVIDRHPQPDYVRAIHRWVLLRALMVTLIAFAVCAWLKPVLETAHAIGMQVFLSASLCLLLTDLFFLRALDVPFTVQRSKTRASLAITLLLYLGVFPPYVWIIVDKEGSIARHWLRVAIFVVAAHLILMYWQRRTLRERAQWLEVEDEDEFPLRLGLT